MRRPTGKLLMNQQRRTANFYKLAGIFIWSAVCITLATGGCVHWLAILAGLYAAGYFIQRHKR